MALSAGKFALLYLAARAGAQVTCKGTFEPITAYAFASGLNPGWNAGNSLDAIPTETSWGQPLLVNSTFINVKNHGFNGVRLPGTLSALLTMPI
jgi:endoglucanase